MFSQYASTRNKFGGHAFQYFKRLSSFCSNFLSLVIYGWDVICYSLLSLSDLDGVNTDYYNKASAKFTCKLFPFTSWHEIRPMFMHRKNGTGTYYGMGCIIHLRASSLISINQIKLSENNRSDERPINDDIWLPVCLLALRMVLITFEKYIGLDSFVTMNKNTFSSGWVQWFYRVPTSEWCFKILLFLLFNTISIQTC